MKSLQTTQVQNVHVHSDFFSLWSRTFSSVRMQLFLFVYFAPDVLNASSLLHKHCFSFGNRPYATSSAYRGAAGCLDDVRYEGWGEMEPQM